MSSVEGKEKPSKLTKNLMTTFKNKSISKCFLLC